MLPDTLPAPPESQTRTLSLRCESGSAMLEFALILPLMILLLIGVVDIGFGIQQSLTVNEAAHAGVTFGSVPGNSKNTSGMQQAAIDAYTGGITPVGNFKANATVKCTCIPAGPAVSCNSTCFGSAPLEYVQVKTTSTMPVIFNYQGLPGSFTFNGFSSFRVQ